MSDTHENLLHRARVRDLCSAVLLVLSAVAVSVGGFFLHPAAGCFALGGSLGALAWLLQRSGGDEL